MEPVRLTLPSPVKKGSTDHFALYDSTIDMARHADRVVQGRHRAGGGSSWTDAGFDQTVTNCIDGSLDAAAASDALLSEFEQVALPSARHVIVDDVVGAAPNVPAYIAGHPFNMRRRQRREHDAAPIAVVVDLTSSAGISAKLLQRRGAAILAFVRALAARRPVELWAGTGLGNYSSSGGYWTFARIQTAPLDLAHAAPVLATAGTARLIGYGLCQWQGSNGRWPYASSGPLTAANLEKVIRPALPHLQEVVCVPAAFITSAPELATPAKWVRDQLEKYTGEEAAA